MSTIKSSRSSGVTTTRYAASWFVTSHVTLGSMTVHDDADPLAELLDRARAERAAAGRRRQRSLARQATESATLAGALLDLAEQRRSVRVTLMGGRSHSGVLAAVGEDFIVLEGSRGSRVAVATRAVVAVGDVGQGFLVAATGDRQLDAVRLVDVVAELADGAGPVLIGTTGSPPFAGEVVAVGVDVVLVRGAGAAAQGALLPRRGRPH
jgi:hypothetical protein